MFGREEWLLRPGEGGRVRGKPFDGGFLSLSLCSKMRASIYWVGEDPCFGDSPCLATPAAAGEIPTPVNTLFMCLLCRSSSVIVSMAACTSARKLSWSSGSDCLYIFSGSQR